MDDLWQRRGRSRCQMQNALANEDFQDTGTRVGVILYLYFYLEIWTL